MDACATTACGVWGEGVGWYYWSRLSLAGSICAHSPHLLAKLTPLSEIRYRDLWPLRPRKAATCRTTQHRQSIPWHASFAQKPIKGRGPFEASLVRGHTLETHQISPRPTRKVPPLAQPISPSWQAELHILCTFMWQCRPKKRSQIL
jgi:hypothetical protein